MPTKVAVPDFCLFFADIALQLVKCGTTSKGEDIIRLVSAAKFDARRDLSAHEGK